MKILLLTPPMIQTNTPYPATAYLTGFLRSRGYDAEQDDVAARVAMRLLSPEGLRDLAADIARNAPRIPASALLGASHFRQNVGRYAEVIQPTLQFLRREDSILQYRLANRTYLPESPFFEALVRLHESFKDGTPESVPERARAYAGLFIHEIVHLVKTCSDEHFEFSKYTESLAECAVSFEPLERRLGFTTLIDRFIVEITERVIAEKSPDLVGLSVPFPGNVYGALRIGKTIKALRPDLPIVMGGGYCNTELRAVRDPRLFKYIDFMTLDDGERPLQCLIEFLAGKRPLEGLLRTHYLKDGAVAYVTAEREHDIPHKDTGTPTYAGMPLETYFPHTAGAYNPMTEMRNCHFWNKLTLAHGCYWRKCTFCDINLDYIGRYDQAGANLLVDRMVTLSAETGSTGFHFVDEACPPVVLAGLSRRILERGLTFSWYGNIRFDRAFTRKLTDQMAAAGCIAVTGGLEVGSDRILAMMEKGTTLEQVAKVARAFTESGIVVHAYLIYGFPTQTAQEVVDSLEIVRQFFAAGFLKSAAWHRFMVTKHSPIGRDPERFGVLLDEPDVAALAPNGVFAQYVVSHQDAVPVDYTSLGTGLRAAMDSYNKGLGIDRDVSSWFAAGVVASSIPPDLIQSLSERVREEKSA